MEETNKPRSSTRLGFHYFNDSLHYRESDLLCWLPELKACGASWLTLITPHDRAIPEGFIRTLIMEGIQPLLHFKPPLPHLPDMDSLKLLFNVYSDWGVRYAVLYDRPNRRQSWPGNSWAQNDLVERFLDLYLPVADLAIQAGLAPVFPPLQPGGDYWDTAFLRAALAGIKRRGQERLVETLVLGAYAWVDGHDLGWGAGGPERWPKARPYITPEGQQDQLGFYITDWYQAIAEAELGSPRSMVVLAAGYPPKLAEGSEDCAIDLAHHTEVHATIARLMAGQTVENPVSGGMLTPPSAYVLSCNFWLLAADTGSPDSSLAWFRPQTNGAPVINLPIVTAMRQLQKYPGAHYFPNPNGAQTPSHRPIDHYLLLSEAVVDSWGQVPDDLLAYIRQYQPTTGFSSEEAALAARVSVLGDEDIFPDSLLESIRSAGAVVERLNGDGISIAPLTATHNTENMRGEP